MARAYEIIEHSYDVVVLGAGGAGYAPHSVWSHGGSDQVAISCACFALAAIGIVATLRIAFDSCGL